MFSVMNETHLHRALKDYYAVLNEGSRKEADVDGYVADILLADGGIIEIQTQSLSHLSKKICHVLASGHTVKVVYPVAVEKYIETQDFTSGSVRRRKSPVKKSIYSAFRELTGLLPYLLDARFSLEFVEVSMTEERIDTGELSQSKNGRRRFRKTWNKSGKRLEKIEGIHVFDSKEDYLKLIPFGEDDEFCVKDVCMKLKKSVRHVKETDVRFLIWCLVKMNLVSNHKKSGNTKFYRFS